MKRVSEFVRAEEFAEYENASRPYQRHSAEDYLQIEDISNAGLLIKAKLLYRHPSLYSLWSGDWTYLNTTDERSISVISEFKENRKPFYLAFNGGFLQVVNIWEDESNDLVFYLQETGNWKRHLN